MTVQRHCAPIALFVYKRPEHARRTIESLRRCRGFSESPLWVFADGPKSETDAASVAATRLVVRELLGDRAIYVEETVNRGLANSIIHGVTHWRIVRVLHS